MPSVRPARRADVPAIVQLQTISLPHFPLPDPGPAFLRAFYAFVLRDHRGLLFVSESNQALAGFVAGFSDPAGLYQNVSSERLRLFAATSACLARHPIQLPRFFQDLRRSSRLTCELATSGKAACELITIAVQPRLRRRGHGRALTRAFLEAARRNKAAQVCVHIGSNDRGMALFYQRLGFIPFRTFRASDTQWMDEYVLTIPQTERAS